MEFRKTVVIAEPAVSTTTANKHKATSEPVDEAALERRRIMREELIAMKEREENEKAKKRQERREAVRQAKEKIHREKREKGITIIPEAAHSREYMKKVLEDEYRLSLKAKQEVLDKEHKRLQDAIDTKLGISALPKGEELMVLTADFYSNNNMPNQHLPESITKVLTTQEINDFRKVFDMFDAKNKGYITADDLRRAAAMLGYKARKRIFKEMIDEISSKDKKGRVTFISFLELVIKLQGDGPDPYEEIQKGFRLLDHGQKGYITSADIRQAADELGVSLSNAAIREMMEEADSKGDGKVTAQEFVKIITQVETFLAPS